MKRAVETALTDEVLAILAAKAGSGISVNARTIASKLTKTVATSRQVAYVLRKLREQGKVAAISWYGSAAIYALTNAPAPAEASATPESCDPPEVTVEPAFTMLKADAEIKPWQDITPFAGADFQAWCEEVHTANIAAGWWDSPRSFLKLLVLVNTELAEAVEGDRKGIMDDHLPQFFMREVEIADAIIRMGDIIGWFIKNTRQCCFRTERGFPFVRENRPVPHREWFLLEVNSVMGRVSQVGSTLTSDPVPELSIFGQTDSLKTLVKIMDQLVGLYEHVSYGSGVFGESIDAKRAYNLTRTDHQRANRAKEGGKTY